MHWLNGVRVLEVGSIAAAFAGKHLAELGADVIRVESDPDPIRDAEPLITVDGRTASALHLYLNAGKRCLDLRERSLADLASRADLILNGLTQPVASSYGLDRASVQNGTADALAVEVTPFGPEGPYAGYTGSDLLIGALSGVTYVTGDPSREPLTPAGHLCEYFAGLNAAVAAVALLLGRERGCGQRWADVSAQEVLTTMIDNAIPNFREAGMLRMRAGNRYGQAPLPNLYLYQCADGFVSLFLPMEAQWEGLCVAVGHPEWLDDPDLADWGGRARRGGEVEEALIEWFAVRSREEIIQRFQQLRLPCAVGYTLREVLDDPQHAARGFFGAENENGIRMPRLPFLISGEAPLAPASTEDVADDAWPDRAPRERKEEPGGATPLEGVRIVDMTQTWAGPYCTTMLADLGAEVIKVESPSHPDMARLWAQGGDRPADFYDRSPGFLVFGRNKLSLSLRVDDPQGLELLRDLISRSDVLIDNFSTRVMPNLGLDPVGLLEANPRLVELRMPGFGTTGPYRDFVSYGFSLEAVAGITMLSGYDDGGPMRLGVAYADPVASCYAAMAIIAALNGREAGGGGCVIDLSQFESTERCIGEQLIQAQATGEQPPRFGNKHPRHAPHGIYRCTGDDEWLAVAVETNAQWLALCDVLGLDAVAGDETLREAEGRKANEARLDAAISSALAGREKREAMERLQAAGVAAAAVLSIPDVVSDPQLAARGFFQEVAHSKVGSSVISGRNFRLGPVAEPPLRGAPVFGRDTDDVLTRILGLSVDDVKGLRDAGVVGGLPDTG